MKSDNKHTSSKLGVVVIVIVVAVGLLILGLAVFGGSSQNCPSGQVWSAEHQHCH